MKNPIRWDNLTSPQIKALSEQNAIVLLPLGSTEQHGPHLPVGTDAILSTAVSEGTAKELSSRGIPCIVAPTFAVANSRHHMNFAGSMSLFPDTFMQVLLEQCRCIAAHGFKRIVLVNGHGGNKAPATAAQVRINEELGFPVYFTGYWAGASDVCKAVLESQSGMIHACESETSLVLAVDESLVDPIYKETKGNPGDCTTLEDKGLISTFHRMESHTPNGVMGNAYLATKEKGTAMLNTMISSLSDIVSAEELWDKQV